MFDFSASHWLFAPRFAFAAVHFWLFVGVILLIALLIVAASRDRDWLILRRVGRHFRIPIMIMGALALAVSLSPPANAEPTAPGSVAHRTTAMHPSALTLGSHRTRPHHQGVGRHGNARGRQLHTNPTHGTMAGPRI